VTARLLHASRDLTSPLCLPPALSLVKGGCLSSDNNHFIDIEQCEFSNNECIQGPGGALYVSRYSTASLVDSTLAYNDAEDSGGAHFVPASDGDTRAEVVSCIFQVARGRRNLGKGRGGGRGERR